ncbi:MAG: ThiF family adenylyltransferase [Flavobacteriales bacterium]|nr:ThiF family adenylyltransferase [Flavobacteriales bacterium]
MAAPVHRAAKFILSNPSGLDAWRTFTRETHAPLDASLMAGQWKEWFKCSHPGDPVGDATAAFSAREGSSPTGRYGTVVWYPWRQKAVLLLEEAEFIAVRTNRNRNKIRGDEQQALLEKSVGVVGMSVGRSVAMALAMERIVGRLHLADADTLELSNLNRIPASVFELGTSKLVSAARAIAEIDPYLEVELWPSGFAPEVMSDFLGGLDAVVDACDDPAAKALLRLGARDRRMPLVMETNDRGLVDIERYDLEETEDFLHGRLTAEQLTELAGGGAWTPELLDAFVDLSAISDRARESLNEVGKTLVGWPQLHSDVAIGAGMAATAIRRLLLGEDLADQRIRFDFNEQLSIAHTA